MQPGERFNAITHLIGTILAIVGTVVLVTMAMGLEGSKRVAAVSIYGATLILLYLISTLYHSLSGPAKHVFHVLDHCGIYLLIAGTYTPFTLVLLEGEKGWWVFGIVWTLAAIGVYKDARYFRRFRWISYVLYLGMGWIIVFFWSVLEEALPASGLAWLFAGGIFYTAGLTFLAMARRVPYTHGAWHLCVMAGSICHYVVMVRHVVAAPSA